MYILCIIKVAKCDTLMPDAVNGSMLAIKKGLRRDTPHSRFAAADVLSAMN